MMNDNFCQLPTCLDLSDEGIYKFLVGVIIDVLRRETSNYFNAHFETKGCGYKEGMAGMDEISMLITPEISKERTRIAYRLICGIWSSIGLSNVQSKNDFAESVLKALDDDMNYWGKKLEEMENEKAN